MGRWIGIDYGKKRVGMALTDPLGLISFPHDTIAPKEVIAFVEKYLKEGPIEGIVIGMPYTLQYTGNEMTRLVKAFTRLLHRYFPQIPLYHHDERFTSKIAQDRLFEEGLSKKKRRDKKRLDAMSASLILRSFLRLHALGRSEPVAFPSLLKG